MERIPSKVIALEGNDYIVMEENIVFPRLHIPIYLDIMAVLKNMFKQLKCLAMV